MRKNYLVTGGAGYIGSVVVEELLAAGAERVVVLDDLSTGDRGNLASAGGVTLVAGTRTTGTGGTGGKLAPLAEEAFARSFGGAHGLSSVRHLVTLTQVGRFFVGMPSS